jgi:hypothetical protein
MGSAYNLRHGNEAIFDIARAMQLPLAELAGVPAAAPDRDQQPWPDPGG